MNFILRCAFVLAVVIAWTYDHDAPTEHDAAVASAASLDDAQQAAVVAARGK